MASADNQGQEGIDSVRFREVLPGSTSRLACVDHRETYGRHIIREWSGRIPRLNKVLDLGCGNGDDLRAIRQGHPEATCWGVDVGGCRDALGQDGIGISLDIERESLPFGNEEIDLVVANQVLEHTKEVFWINHEIARVLTVGGFFILGVPNVLSLHNRILGLVGVHPTSNKMCSAHVRPFSKGDVRLFYKACFPGGYELVSFRGSQFYPFPKPIARPLSTVFPSLSVSIFFLFEKKRAYGGEFIEYPGRARLETVFFGGGQRISA